MAAAMPPRRGRRTRWLGNGSGAKSLDDQETTYRYLKKVDIVTYNCSEPCPAAADADRAGLDLDRLSELRGIQVQHSMR